MRRSLRRALDFAAPLALLGAGAAWLAWSFVPTARGDALQRWQAQLSAMADDRQKAVESVVADGFTEAAVLASFPSAKELSSGPVTRRGVEVGQQAHLGDVLDRFVEGRGHVHLWVLDRSGGVLAEAGAATNAAPGCLRLGLEAVRSGEGAADFALRADRSPALCFAAPIRGASEGSVRWTGAVVVETDPRVTLYPFLESQPLSIRTAECLLVKRDGAEMTFVSPLRHSPAPPLTLRRRADDLELAASHALRGESVFGEFVDYRREPIFAATRPIRNAPWGLVAKVDRAEAFEDVPRRLRNASLAGLGALLGLAALGFAFSRAQRAEAGAALARSQRESEEKFRQIFELDSVALVLVENDTGRILEANGAASAMYGYAHEELLGLRNVDLSAQPEETRRATVETKPSHVLDRLHRRRDGTTFPVEIYARHFAWQGRGVHVAAITDIAERRRTEERVHLLNRLLRMQTAINALIVRANDPLQLFEAACAIAVQQGELRMAWIGEPDAATGRLLPIASAGHVDGYLDEVTVPYAESTASPLGPAGLALRDRKPAIIGDILSDPRFAPWREAAARRGYRSIVALPLAPRQGPARVLCLYSVAAGVFDAETVELLQQLVGDLEYALDALEVRRQHGEAEAQVRRLFQAVEQSPVTVVITDASGAIQYVNPCFSRVTGYSREEAIGQNPRVLKSGVHPPEFYAELWARLESGREWRGQLCNRTKGGELFWEEAVISPVKDGDGRITSYIAVKEDVSERRKLEERLLQSQKMEAVGRLAGGIAHDFNNMLSVITGHVELALRTSYDGDPRRRHLLEVRKAAERAASLTRQLLAFSRKQVLQPKPIDLNAVLADMNKMLQRLIGEDVDLEIQPAAGLGTVLADPGQIEQVLLNLAVNARDAMPDGGRLTLATANVDLAEADAQRRGLAPPGRYVCLAVEDTGCGIRDEIREHIFEPFFTTKEPGKGTGLGLSTVYGIVKQSGGYIWVSSGVDRGARFDIYLPLLDQRPAQPDLLAPAPQRTAKAGTILLVEDNDALRGLVREMLEASGYTVVEAADGVEALQLVARNGAIDLLLTDVIMPRLGGRELARRAAALRPALKVLYTSGYTADAIAVQGVLEEGLAFLPKPFTPDALALKVDEALKSGATRDDTRPAGPAVAPRP